MNICHKCNKDFKNSADLKRHLNRIKPCNIKTEYKCEICLVTFKTKCILTSHKNRKFPCVSAIVKLEEEIKSLKIQTQNQNQRQSDNNDKIKIDNINNNITNDINNIKVNNTVKQNNLKIMVDDGGDDNENESKPFTNQITTSKTLNNIDITLLIKNYNKLLSIKELLNIINYDINNLFIDKFWNSIEDDSWIYLDDELIIWFGYKDITNGKKKLLGFIKNSDNGEFKLLNNEEYNKSCWAITAQQDKSWGGSNKQHIILSCDCFKEICIKIGTSKSKEIIKYFLEIEKVFKFYNKYILAFKNFELQQSTLIHNILINKTLLINNSKLYLITNHQMAKENIFKFGKTDNEKARISSYNTGHVEANKFFYVSIYDCYDATSLEKRIAKLLINFKIPNESEMYQLHYNALDYIIKEICKSEDKSINKINSFIKNDYEKFINLEPIKFNKNMIIEN
jgi:phage anti-repressor protein